MVAKLNDKDIFLNCPFDPEYWPLLEAILFGATICGYRIRSGLEVEDSGQVRLVKICGIIGQCRLTIHDISRTVLDQKNQLPRFNMPFELGLDIGARTFGTKIYQKKELLILDVERYRYQKFLSDIAGQDIKEYNVNYPGDLVCKVRDWLKSYTKESIPGPVPIKRKFDQFLSERTIMCETLSLDPTGQLGYADLIELIRSWLIQNVA